MSTNGEQHITVREAQVRTASITVRTLAFNDKQMTLAVFRQLPCEDIIPQRGISMDYSNGHISITHGTPKLVGTPWGWVNYFWTGCDPEVGDEPATEERVGRDSERLHVVWQKGEELRRCLVYHDADRVWGSSVYLCKESVYDYGTILVALRLLAGSMPFPANRSRRPRVLVKDLGPHGTIVPLPHGLEHLFGSFGPPSLRPALERYLENHPYYSAGQSEADVLAQANEWERLMREQQDVWSTLYEHLSTTGQLFIAV